MDIWLLKCMMFVALATFEYAILLGVRFDKGRNMSSMGCEAENNEKKKCNRVDRICLEVFMATYILVVVAYFIVVTQSN